MLVRRIARPLFAAWFVAEGVDAARRPQTHVHHAETTWRQLAARASIPAPPPTARMRTLVRAHGVTTAVAGLMLASGKAPRAAALALAALAVPLAVVNHPFGRDRAEYRERFLRNLSMIGGALIVGLDREGRPGVAWRVEHAKVDRAAAKHAKETLTEAARAARADLRHARRASA
ncbi:DoxX family membrane protein [Cellulomonas sp. KRMCY2]|uniref:DoxX family membrane protein n=1 Tax=Cellulomonas sp. KRMCY2 TaxID=1304865 RepID=UPI00045E5F54|nr:DoxX family membrane protein [Cellulomonas sp. KRMCY2]